MEKPTEIPGRGMLGIAGSFGRSTEGGSSVGRGGGAGIEKPTEIPGSGMLGIAGIFGRSTEGGSRVGKGGATGIENPTEMLGKGMDGNSGNLQRVIYFTTTELERCVAGSSCKGANCGEGPVGPIAEGWT
jgi:hypothetical protein